MSELTFKNKVTTNPGDVKPLDAFAIKVVAWVHGGGYSWAAYYGPSDWTDEQVAFSGDVLLEEAARSMFYVLDATGILYEDT